MRSRSQRGQENEALGRSRGGFSSKIHTLVDGLGNPLNFILTAGQSHDITQAQALLQDYSGEQVVGDKAYDSSELLKWIDSRNALAVIPPRQNRKQQREYDLDIYKERHLVECFFNKLKYYRRVFSRFEKRARNYLSFVHFCAALIWLR